MRAMVLTAGGQPLQLQRLEAPSIGPQELLIRVHAWGVCRTDLHVVDGELPDPKANVIPGHEVVGEVQAIGDDVKRFTVGQSVGTGYTRDGGYASPP